jgi:ADP-ribose pyrophosphatase
MERVKKPKVLQSKKPFVGKVVNLRIDDVVYPDGHTATREIVEHPGGAVVLPILPDGRIILVEQYRHPAKAALFELPAGKLEPGEPPEQCALRELEEETGYTAASLIPLGSIYTSPGFCDERLHLFLAREITEHPDGQRLDPGESLLRIHAFQLKEIIDMIDAGTICDGKTISALFLAGRKNG